MTKKALLTGIFLLLSFLSIRAQHTISQSVATFIDDEVSLKSRLKAAEQIPVFSMMTPEPQLIGFQKIFTNPEEPVEVRLEAFKRLMFIGTQVVTPAVKVIKSITEPAAFRAECLPILAENWNTIGPYSGLKRDAQKQIADIVEWGMTSEKPVIRKKAEEANLIIKREIELEQILSSLFPLPATSVVEEALGVLENQEKHPILRAKLVAFLEGRIFFFARNNIIFPKQAKQYYEIVNSYLNSGIPILADSASKATQTSHDVRIFLFRDQIYPFPKSATVIDEAIAILKDKTEAVAFRAEAIYVLTEVSFPLYRNQTLTAKHYRDLDKLADAYIESEVPELVKAGKKVKPMILEYRQLTFKELIIPNDDLEENLDVAISLLKDENENPELRKRGIGMLGYSTKILQHGNSLSEENLKGISELFEELSTSSDSALSDSASKAMGFIYEKRLEDFKKTIFPEPTSETSIDEAISLIKGKTAPESFRVNCFSFMMEKRPYLTENEKITESEINAIKELIEWAENSGIPAFEKAVEGVRAQMESEDLNALKRSIFPIPKYEEAIFNAVQWIKNDSLNPDPRIKGLQFIGENLESYLIPGRVVETDVALLKEMIIWASTSSNPVFTETASPMLLKLEEKRLKEFKASIFPVPVSDSTIYQAIKLIKNKEENSHYRAACMGYIFQKYPRLIRSNSLTASDQLQLLQLGKWASDVGTPPLPDTAFAYLNLLNSGKFEAFKKTIHPFPEDTFSIENAVKLIRQEYEPLEFRAQCLAFFADKYHYYCKAGITNEEDSSLVRELFDWAALSEDPLILKSAKPALEAILRERFLQFKQEVYPQPEDDAVITSAIETIKNITEDIQFRADCLDYLADKAPQLNRLNAISFKAYEDIRKAVLWAYEASGEMKLISVASKHKKILFESD